MSYTHTYIHSHLARQSRAVTYDTAGAGHAGPGLSLRLVGWMHYAHVPSQNKQQINNNHESVSNAIRKFGHSNALQFRTLRFTCMTLTRASVAQQPVVPADLYPSRFSTCMPDTKYKHGTTGCPAGPGPCGHINSAACANSDCSTYMLATRYEHGTAGCPAGPGPLWPHQQRYLRELGPVANHERLVALS